MTTYETLADATLARGSCRSSSRSSRRSRSAARSPGWASSPPRSATGCRTSRCARWRCCPPTATSSPRRPDSEHADLFPAFPNSYGTLGYALRLEIELQPVAPLRPPAARARRHRRPGQGDRRRLRPRPGSARLRRRHRVRPATSSTSRSAGSPTTPAARAQRLHRAADLLPLDPTSAPTDVPDRRGLPLALGHRLVLVLARVRRAAPGGAPAVAAALPPLRRLPPARRARPAHRALRPGPARCAGSRRRSRSSRTSRSRSSGSPSSSTSSTARSASPRCGCARCGCAASAPGRSTRWPRASCTSTSASGRPCPSGPGDPQAHNRLIERAGRRPRRPQVAVLDRPLRRGRVLAALQRAGLPRGEGPLRPGRAAARPLHEGDRITGGTMQVAEIISSAGRGGRARYACRLRRQQGRAGQLRAGPADQLAAGARLPRHRAGHARAGPRLRRAASSRSRATSTSCSPPWPTSRSNDLAAPSSSGSPARMLPIWLRHRQPPPAAGVPARRGRLHSKLRDAKAISHHYDVSNRFYEWVLGPSMAYTCAVLPDGDGDAGGGAGRQVRPGRAEARRSSRACGCSTSAAAGAAWSCTPRPSTACKALGVTLSRNQAEWAQAAIERRGLGGLAEVRHLRLPRRAGVRVRRDQLDRPHRAHRQGATCRPTSRPCTAGCGPAGGCSTTASPSRAHRRKRRSTRSSTATSSPTASWRRSG